MQRSWLWILFLGSEGSLLIPQVFDFLFVHAEVVRDLVQDGEADLPAELGGIGKITRQGLGEDGDLVGQYRRIDCGEFLRGRESFLEPRIGSDNQPFYPSTHGRL